MLVDGVAWNKSLEAANVKVKIVSAEATESSSELMEAPTEEASENSQDPTDFLISKPPTEVQHVDRSFVPSTVRDSVELSVS
jgi:hypothetical protein